MYLPQFALLWFLLFAPLILFRISEVSAQTEGRPLTLIRALPVDGPANSQPSGLTIYNHTLYTVSDKHSDTIYRLEIRDDRAVMMPHITFEAPPLPGIRGLDLEGIAHDEAGRFFLVSERAFRILRVGPDGKDAVWITDSLKPVGEAVGLFRTPGGGLEGVARLDDRLFLVCAERQPRGLIEIDTNADPHTTRAFNGDATSLPIPEGRNQDFTDLFWDGRDLYVLLRNAMAICKLRYGGAAVEEYDVWSFAHIVDRPDLRYADTRFGTAEGLCMDRDRVYVILDNNGIPRAADPDDRRPLLLIMARP